MLVKGATGGLPSMLGLAQICSNTDWQCADWALMSFKPGTVWSQHRLVRHGLGHYSSRHFTSEKLLNPSPICTAWYVLCLLKSHLSYWWIDVNYSPKLFRFTSLALGQLYNYPRASEEHENHFHISCDVFSKENINICCTVRAFLS